MKTVQYYLDLGVKFVKGDVVLGRKSREYSRDWFKALVDSENTWVDDTIKLFAWRNNDGVKPEYKGLIHAMFENGVIIQDFADSLNWGSSFNPIIQWRPVVYACNHTELKSRHSFVTAIGIDGPKFWNKSIKTLNCPCIAVNIEAIKPTVSPKEDKPMKPSYTAEMHAKGELPPVDSKVKVCIEEAGFYVDEQDVKFEGKAVTVKAAFSNAESEKIVAVENEDGNCYCYIIECIKPIIKTIKVNGFDVPAPMSEAPKDGDEYFLPSINNDDFVDYHDWHGDRYDKCWISRGMLHSTKSAAISHAKAMLGIDPNA